MTYLFGNIIMQMITSDTRWVGFLFLFGCCFFKIKLQALKRENKGRQIFCEVRVSSSPRIIQIGNDLRQLSSLVKIRSVIQTRLLSS